MHRSTNLALVLVLSTALLCPHGAHAANKDIHFRRANVGGPSAAQTWGPVQSPVSTGPHQLNNTTCCSLEHITTTLAQDGDH